MISHYKGYEIEVKREECMAGYDLLYFTITRESDGYLCEGDFTDEEATVREFIGYMMERIDNEHKEDDPWNIKTQSHENKTEKFTYESPGILG